MIRGNCQSRMEQHRVVRARCQWAEPLHTPSQIHPLPPPGTHLGLHACENLAKWRVPIVIFADLFHGTRVLPVDLLLKIVEQLLRLSEIIRDRFGEADRHDTDDRHTFIDGSEQLDNTPWPREHAARLDEHQHVALPHLLAERVQVGEVIRVKECAPLEMLLDELLQIARLRLALCFTVRDERAESHRTQQFQLLKPSALLCGNKVKGSISLVVRRRDIRTVDQQLHARAATRGTDCAE
eukprot:6309687-Prymnesium_polylepis.1